MVEVRFPMGQLLITPGAQAACDDAGQNPGVFVSRHVQCDWGEVCEEDQNANDHALIDGGRLLSAYRTLRNVRLWIVTEAEDDRGRRLSTTILRPEEY